MKLTSREMLHRLGAGESIAEVCAAAGQTPNRFDDWWKAETASRVLSASGTQRGPVKASVRISRDRWGIPHISADHEDDLFFGFGYAQAQDRLFQLDFLRRRGAGRLSEILGSNGGEMDVVQRTVGFQNVFELDRLARTVGLQHIAEAEWPRLPVEVQRLLQAFSAGINAVIEHSRNRLPIEFDLLEYEPEPWTPIDSLTIESEFRWYLTGRFPVICIPELARRTFGAGQIWEAFMQNENDEESILHPGEYARARTSAQPIGRAMNDPESGIGSNNWVLGGQRTATGRPLLASDPHIAFEASSCWWQAHLQAGAFHVAGMAYVGMPAIMFGRTERVAWGCTNNICSQRDLYQEKTDPAHPNCFQYNGRWEPTRSREETIVVKGRPSVQKTIHFSRNGPIVDEILPPPMRNSGPVSLKWLGAYEGGWLSALLGMNRANSAAELREATRPWHVPTFSVVFADSEGHIGYQSVGRIPIRNFSERGYRPGWDPQHQWDGLIPFEGMPAVMDPARGWVATANNRPAPNDFPYPLSGTWTDGLRAARIREMIEGKPKLTRQDTAAMQQDAISMRARRCLPPLIAILSSSADSRVQEAVRHLREWDYHMEPDRVGATIFDVFFTFWSRSVIRERAEGDIAGLLTGGATGLAARLLVEDWCGWFASGRREHAIHVAMNTAMEAISERLGPDMKSWTWGRLHVLPLRHVLSGRGELALLLDHGHVPVKGDMSTVCNTGLGGDWEARSGAGYRMIADLSEAPGLWTIDVSGQSGQPGSHHYSDQIAGWIAGQYYFMAMGAVKDAMSTLIISPQEPRNPN